MAVILIATVTSTLAQDSLSLAGTKGESFDESELSRGRHIVVVWASWSPRGRDIAERVARVHARWGGQAARVMTVNFQEDRGTVTSYLSGKNLPVPVFIDRDGAFAKKHGVTALPGLLIFKDGQTVFRGRLPADPDPVIGQSLN